jgi:hypothetical protein
MFKPRPRIERVGLGAAGACWVVDDALLDPDALVATAVREQGRFAPAPHNAYPGLEWLLEGELPARLNDFFTLHVRALLGARRTVGMYARLSLATLQPRQLRPLQRLCHRDRFGVTPDQTVAACTLYLFGDAALGGTSFYVPRQGLDQTNALIRQWSAMDDETFTQAIGREPGYITAGNDWFDLAAVVPAAYNRAVFYDGSLFHSSHITQPARLSAEPSQGRLTLNGFFVCKRAAT